MYNLLTYSQQKCMTIYLKMYTCTSYFLQVPCTLRQARADPRWAGYTVTPPSVGCSASDPATDCAVQATPTYVKTFY